MKLIGLCGDIGAGKDTVARHLVKQHGFVAMSFAQKLKEVAADVFGLEDRHVFGSQEDKAEPIHWVRDAAGQARTGRSILEWLGTEGFRTVDPNVWVKHAMRRPDELAAIERTGGSSYAGIVFSDARFPNEFQAIRSRGGLVWQVVKVGGPDHGRTGHASDDAWRAIPKDDRVVAKHGDMQGLKAATDIALNGQLG